MAISNRKKLELELELLELEEEEIRLSQQAAPTTMGQDVADIWSQTGKDIKEVAGTGLTPIDPAVPIGALGEVAEGVGQTIGRTIFEPAMQGIANLPLAGTDKDVGDVLAAGARSAPVQGAIGAVTGFGGAEAAQAVGEAGEDFYNWLDPSTQSLLRGGAKTAFYGPEAVVAGSLVKGGTKKAIESLPLVKGAKSGVTAAAAPFTEAGGAARAQRAAGKTVEDLEATPYQMQGPSPITSPATRTGDPGMMAIEKTAAEIDPALARGRKTQIEDDRSRIIGSLQPEGDIRTARGYVAERAATIKQGLQRKSDKALEMARNRIDKVKTARTEAEVSSIVREELDAAMRATKADEAAAWGRVKNYPVDSVQTRAKYQALLDDLGDVKDDIPKKAWKYLDPESPDAWKGTKSMKDMKSLRSQLLREGRQSSPAGAAQGTANPNRSRMAYELAEAVLEEMGAHADALTPNGKLVAEALAQSKALHDTYRRGKVGQILRRSSEGLDQIDPRMTLSKTTGTGNKIQGAVETERILAAADTPETRQAIADYMLEKLREAAIDVQTGAFNAKAAATFVDKNKEIFRKFPEVKTNIENAISATGTAERAVAREAAVSKGLTKAQDSAVTRLLESKAGAEISKVMAAKNPKEAARELMKIVRKDPDAVAGVRAAAMEDLIAKSKGKGDKMLEILKNKNQRDALSEIMGVTGLRRTEFLAKELNKLDLAEKAGTLDALIGDKPSKLISFVVSTIGARSGAKLGAGTSGASLKTASLASNEAKAFLEGLVGDKATKIMAQSISDERLWKILVDNKITAPAEIAKTEKAIKAWMASPAAAWYVAMEDE